MTEDELVIQIRKNHPFIDLYACPCSEATAYDSIANMLQFTDDDKVLYLGDSENDNSAFKKADISIGIRSDDRTKTPRMQTPSGILKPCFVFKQTLK